MSYKCFQMLTVCLILTLALLTACSASTEVSYSGETSVPPVSSETEVSAEEEKRAETVFELFDGFSVYDPSSDLTYEEYFSEERYLEKTTLDASQEVLTGYPSDMPGYQYVKGSDSDETDWESGHWYWNTPFDNLYLYHIDTGERTLLAELAGITRLLVFPDRLYLLTERAVWRCGRLGENLTCVYEHSTRIYANDLCEWAEVIFFETLDTDTAEIWRLHVPSGTAERLCAVDELDRYASGDSSGYIPITNEAFLYARAGRLRVERYIYSARTGQCAPLEGEEELGEAVSMDDLFAWIHAHYRLNGE